MGKSSYQLNSIKRKRVFEFLDLMQYRTWIIAYKWRWKQYLRDGI